MIYEFKNMVFVFDIDGTLIPSSSNFIDVKLLDLLKELSIANKVFFASARPMDGIKNLLPQHILNSFNYISLNGAYSLIEGVEYEAKPLKNKQVKDLVNRFNSGSLWLYSKNNWYSSDLISSTYHKESEAVKMKAICITKLDRSEKIHKAILISDKMEDVEYLKKSNYNYCNSNVNYIEINSAGVDKSLFLSQVNIDQNKLCSFGDAENDLPLLKVSAYSISMQSSNSKLSSISHYNTSSNYYKGINEGLHYINHKIKTK